MPRGDNRKAGAPPVPGAGRKPTALDRRKPDWRGKIIIGISPAAAAQLQQLMLRQIEGVLTPEEMLEHLIRQATDEAP